MSVNGFVTMGRKAILKKSGTPTFGGLFFLLPLALLAVTALIINRRLAIWLF